MGGGAGGGAEEGGGAEGRVGGAGCKCTWYVLREGQRVQKECVELNELKYIQNRDCTILLCLHHMRITAHM